MQAQVEIVREPIDCRADLSEQPPGETGARVEFIGLVRAEESGREIAALEYEAYVPMAERIMREIIDDIGRRHAASAVRVLHRIGVIPVGEAAIRVVASGRHRAEVFEMVTRFMDRLKEDAPIWKRRSLSAEELAHSYET